MTDTPMTSQLMTPLYASAAMRAIMSDRARLQRMLDFEAALARAEAAVGVITATGAAAIGEACDAALYDIAALVEAPAPSGNIAIAVVKALTQAVAARDPAAANFVHWGATSQDVIDTALVLELRAAIDALLADLDLAIKGFTTLAGRHRRTLSVARTLMQHALPMPFGLKLAGYARGAGALARTAAAAPPRGAGAAVRRRRRHARRRSASTASACPSGSRRCSTCNFPTRPGTPTATAWPRSPPASASWPAPAARSPAT